MTSAAEVAPTFAIGARWRYENATTFATTFYEVVSVDQNLVTLRNSESGADAWASIRWMTGGPNGFGSRWVCEGTAEKDDRGSD